ncbi:stalk domain-containing protein [Cohnella mopanensis]|uniref:stalk domain-containing protein n=1 Tax=Cohnella mopanensis TaxID=2911966 RepID=UPI001EF804B6|nr:stalk domain-containing protein [Cohnella mopanensis]
MNEKQQHNSQARHKRTRLILPLLAGVLVFTGSVNAGSIPVAKAATQAAVTYKLVQQGESIVTSGVRQLTYAWVPSDKTKPTEVLHVLQVDLKNPYVQLNAMGGPKGSVTARQSVGAMVKETGAIAGINGDVFRTGSASEGVPMGAQINEGQLLVSTELLQGMYAFGVTKDRQPIIDNFIFTGQVTTAGGSTFAITGLNKAAYRTEPDKAYSHVNSLYMYTSAWTAPERPANSGATPTEALVVDDIVTEISSKSAIQTAIPTNGFILRGHGTAADFITTNLAVGDRINTTASLKSKDGKIYDPSEFQMMVSGHTLLMDKGAATPFSRDISGVSGGADRARTAVGYSKDGNTAYLLTVEENGGRKGVTLKELQQMLAGLGVWKAVNLDGGGSTTMVSRPLGEFQAQLTHPTSYGTTQRLVTNGIGIYTTAPQGALKGIVASGAQTLFMGQQATYSLKAYDTYYNPIDPSGLTPNWSLDNQVGTLVDGTLTATKTGSAKLQVKSGNASDALSLEIIGEAQIAKLIVEPNTAVLKPGAVISVPVKAQLTDGRQLPVPASSVTWEFRGFKATMSADGKMTVDKVDNNISAGYAIARYDGYGAVAVLAPGTERLLEDFEKASYNVSFSGTPPVETVGATSITTGIPGRETSKVLVLDYDFTLGSGKRFANAVLNDGKGITIDGTPSTLTLDILGDQSMHWLRAEFTDVNGKPAYATIADQIDWTGWKNLRVDLAGAGLKGPAKLTKLYIVNKEEDQDERAVQGQLAFDNLTLQYPPDQIKTVQPTIVMTVGKKQATVDGKKVTLPGAPFVQKGTNTNYLPLRFVADSLGAQVVWNNKTKRVTVLRGDKMLELWVGTDTMTVNGVRQPVATAPVLLNNSVYVPVRIISEQLGQKVDWVGKTQTITIH